MSAPEIEQVLGRALAAAQAAVPLLPASSPLMTAEPTQDAAAIAIEGQAIKARFTGGAQGEVLVVVAQDLVDAMAETPLGSLDVTQAVRPALEAAAGTLGPVVVDPGNITDTAGALASIVAAGGSLVPLSDGPAGRGGGGLGVTADTGARRPGKGGPPPSARRARPAPARG